MKLGSLIARLVVGGLFIGHGTQKLFGWFGGHGPEATGEYFESVGITPGKPAASAAGASEAVGGLLLASGLFTPLAAASISGVMLTAIRKVHAKQGVWVTEGGAEYNVVLLALMFALTEVGPGPYSLDRALGIEASGTGWALAQLGAAGIGSSFVIASARDAAQDGQEAAEQAAGSAQAT
jgi:putative oxidoreductase